MANLTTQSSELRLLYIRYKQVLLAFGLILVSFVLVFEFLMPQIDDFNIQRKQLEQQQKRIDTMNANLTFLDNTNHAQADTSFDTVTSALPSKKDYQGMLSSISNAAAKSNIQLEDYSFSVGDVATLSAQQETPSVLEIKITLAFKGTVPQTKQFVDSIYTTFPMAKISNIVVGKTAGSMQISFLYSAFPKINLQLDDPLTGFNQREADTLAKISSWGNGTSGGDSGSSTGSTNSNPFGQGASSPSQPTAGSSSAQLGL